MAKRKARALTRSTRQTGSSNMARDRKRKALAPGKRRSKKGNIYYENRKNRSDVKGRDTPISRKKRIKRGVKANSAYGDRSIKKRKVAKKKMTRAQLVKKYGEARVKRAEQSVKRLDAKIKRIRATGYAREPLRGVRRHDLLPKSVRAKIPKLYSQDGKKDPIVYAKFFSPYSGYTFYITEFDGKDTLFGYVANGQGSEWGYSSFKELVTANRRGLPLIERDKYFSPKKASKISAIKRLKR